MNERFDNSTPLDAWHHRGMWQSIRAVAFDLDNTLWDVRRVLERAEAASQAFLSEHYPNFSASYSIEALRAARMELARAEPQSAYDLTWLRIETVRRLAIDLGLPHSVGQEAFEVFIAERNRVELFDDVPSAIGELAMRFRLATLSNGNADVARIGIGHWFAVNLSAGLIGAAKPDVRAFATLAADLGLTAEQILYVGDDPHADVVGAARAGMRTAWINRGAQQWPDELPRADIEVIDLAALVAASRG